MSARLELSDTKAIVPLIRALAAYLAEQGQTLAEQAARVQLSYDENGALSSVVVELED